MQQEQEHHESSAQKFGKDIMVIVGGVLQRVEYTPISSDAKPCVKNALRCNCFAHRNSEWRLKDKQFKLAYDFAYKHCDSSDVKFWGNGLPGPLFNNKGLYQDGQLLIELSSFIEHFETNHMEFIISNIKSSIREVHMDMLSRCRIIEVHQMFANSHHDFDRSLFVKAIKANVLDSRIANHLALEQPKRGNIEFDIHLPLIDYGEALNQYLAKVERVEKYRMQWSTTHYYKDEITYLLHALHIFQLLNALKPKCACDDCELYALYLEEHSYLVRGMLAEGRIMVLFRKVAEYEAAQCSTDSGMVNVDGLDMYHLEEHFRSNLSDALWFVPALIDAISMVFCVEGMQQVDSEQDKGLPTFDCITLMDMLVGRCQRWYQEVLDEDIESDDTEDEATLNRITHLISKFDNLSG